MIQVYSAADPPDAHLVHDLLERNGIRAIIQGEDLWFGRGVLPISADTAPSVWVDDADAEQARRLIDEREERRRAGRAVEEAQDAAEDAAEN